MTHLKLRPRRRLRCRPLTGQLLCDERGCRSLGFDCYLPDEPDRPYALYCAKHAEANGHCKRCGQFWGGVESFDVGPHAGLCDHCADEIESDVAHDAAWDSFDRADAEAAIA